MQLHQLRQSYKRWEVQDISDNLAEVSLKEDNLAEVSVAEVRLKEDSLVEVNVAEVR